ncbi:hypothetical protein M407DRAFT_97918 [Tulasnella calospora MUT 4182]|uniref:Uncharacterized protein n=1 Tax=Tulasnella calospora MUT 4182 TaxID=1051891 RepID=A0A0C3LTS4_9AGAM|nr:hypothetical protein M407DRAFT_97918 [Tulasnella calospora MUT 4182]
MASEPTAEKNIWFSSSQLISKNRPPCQHQGQRDPLLSPPSDALSTRSSQRRTRLQIPKSPAPTSPCHVALGPVIIPLGLQASTTRRRFCATYSLSGCLVRCSKGRSYPSPVSPDRNKPPRSTPQRTSNRQLQTRLLPHRFCLEGRPLTHNGGWE